MNIDGAINKCPLCNCVPKYKHYDQYNGYYGSDMGEHTIKCSNCGIQITTSNQMSTLVQWNNLQRYVK